MVLPRIAPFDRSRFPDSDGDPMPEVDSHVEQLAYLRGAARMLLEGVERVHVGGNTFLYYDVDDPGHNVCPDIYIAFGVERRLREIYLAFEEGVFPQLVIEIISKSTRKDDLGRKVELYGSLGVQEYYVCDPRSDVRPRRRLYAFEGTNGVLVSRALPDRESAYSALLGTELRVIERFLRIIDPHTGLPLPTLLEEHAAREQAEARARAAEEQMQEAQEARDQAEDAAHAAEARAAAAEAALREALTRLGEEASPSPEDRA